MKLIKLILFIDKTNNGQFCKTFFKHLKFLHNLNRTQLSNDTIKGFEYLKKNFSNIRYFDVPSGTPGNYWIAPNKWEIISAKIFDEQKRENYLECY